MSRKYAISVAMLCSTLFGIDFAPANSADLASASALTEQIRSEGASSVAKYLWGTDGWRQLTKNIASGKKEWIDVALYIDQGTDAGMAEELRDAVFLAMQKNPAYLLRILPEKEAGDRPTSLSDVCSGRTDPAQSYEIAINEVALTEIAVRSVKNKSLRKKQQFCIKKLAAAKHDLKRYFEK